MKVVRYQMPLSFMMLLIMILSIVCYVFKMHHPMNQSKPLTIIFKNYSDSLVSMISVTFKGRRASIGCMAEGLASGQSVHESLTIDSEAQYYEILMFAETTPGHSVILRSKTTDRELFSGNSAITIEYKENIIQIKK